MEQDHPTIVQHSQFHTQGELMAKFLSLFQKAENPSVDEITTTGRYVYDYACKGNQPIGALVELFHDLT